MSSLTLTPTDPALVPNAPTGKYTQFLNLIGVLQQKDSSGNVTTVGSGSVIPVTQVATYASLPTTPAGLYLVVADETKSGAPSFYFFTTSHRYWFAMVQDA